jgi:3-deoxy-manno-octulosonate cytidylyltransferase (CMP-KDO synthetase)
MSKIIAIIPARYASTRFPGKVLEKIGDKTILNMVWEQVKKSKRVDRVIIATDDERISDEVKNFGGEYEMTFMTHKSGTDRCAQVSQKFWDSSIIINVQADEPFIIPEMIDILAERMSGDNWIEIATLCNEIQSLEQSADPNVVKVVKDKFNKVLYFSRATIPHYRDDNSSIAHTFRHIGIYAFRNKVLRYLTSLPQSPLEYAEKLEQLRWMENGYKIYAYETNYDGISIDTPEDLQRALEYFELRGHSEK